MFNVVQRQTSWTFVVHLSPVCKQSKGSPITLGPLPGMKINFIHTHCRKQSRVNNIILLYCFWWRFQCHIKIQIDSHQCAAKLQYFEMCLCWKNGSCEDIGLWYKITSFFPSIVVFTLSYVAILSNICFEVYKIKKKK